MKINIQKCDVYVDAKEDRCPMPLLKVKLALAKMAPDQTVCLLATDEASMKDIPYYLSLVGLPLLEQSLEDGVCRFIIQKK